MDGSNRSEMFGRLFRHEFFICKAFQSEIAADQVEIESVSGATILVSLIS